MFLRKVAVRPFVNGSKNLPGLVEDGQHDNGKLGPELFEKANQPNAVVAVGGRVGPKWNLQVDDGQVEWRRAARVDAQRGIGGAERSKTIDELKLVEVRQEVLELGPVGRRILDDEYTTLHTRPPHHASLACPRCRRIA